MFVCRAFGTALVLLTLVASADQAEAPHATETFGAAIERLGLSEVFPEAVLPFLDVEADDLVLSIDVHPLPEPGSWEAQHEEPDPILGEKKEYEFFFEGQEGLTIRTRGSRFWMVSRDPPWPSIDRPKPIEPEISAREALDTAKQVSVLLGTPRQFEDDDEPFLENYPDAWPYWQITSGAKYHGLWWVTGLRACVDAVSGKVMSFAYWEVMDSEPNEYEPNYSEQQALDIACEFLKDRGHRSPHLPYALKPSRGEGSEPESLVLFLITPSLDGPYLHPDCRFEGGKWRIRYAYRFALKSAPPTLLDCITSRILYGRKLCQKELLTDVWVDLATGEVLRVLGDLVRHDR